MTIFLWVRYGEKDKLKKEGEKSLSLKERKRKNNKIIMHS
jgi:hypothetical protein